MKRIIRHHIYKIFKLDRIVNTEQTKLVSRLINGSTWNFLGTIASRLSSLISTIIISRILGKEGFGEYGILQSTINMLGVFAGMSLGLTATKYIAELKITFREKTGDIIVLTNIVGIIGAGLFSIILIMFGPYIAENYLASNHLGIYLQYCSVLLFFSTLNGVQISSLIGFEAFKSLARINTIIAIISIIITFLFVFWGGFNGAIYALIIIMIINWVLNYLALRNEIKKYNIPINVNIKNIDKDILINFSLPATLSSLCITPVNWYCSALLVNQINGYKEMGVYNAANQWFNNILFLPSIIGQSVLPILSERIGLNDNQNIKVLLFTTIKIISIIVIPIVCILVIFSKNIMSLYGKEFSNDWPVMIVCVITAGIATVLTPIGHIITASSKIWYGFTMNAGWGLLFILFSWIFIEKGALGLAMGRFTAYIFHTIWTIMYVYVYIKKTQNSKILKATTKI